MARSADGAFSAMDIEIQRLPREAFDMQMVDWVKDRWHSFPLLGRLMYGIAWLIQGVNGDTE